MPNRNVPSVADDALVSPLVMRTLHTCLLRHRRVAEGHHLCSIFLVLGQYRRCGLPMLRSADEITRGCAGVGPVISPLHRKSMLLLDRKLRRAVAQCFSGQ